MSPGVEHMEHDLHDKSAQVWAVVTGLGPVGAVLGTCQLGWARAVWVILGLMLVCPSGAARRVTAIRVELLPAIGALARSVVCPVGQREPPVVAADPSPPRERGQVARDVGDSEAAKGATGLAPGSDDT